MEPRVQTYFQTHRQELLEDIMALVKIPSVNAPAAEGAPFGPECARVLDFAVLRAQAFGMEARVLDHRVAVVDLNQCPPRLDILAHLDVVPAGDGWSVTQPFQPLLLDGRLYGRGTCDDKGPAVAALYAMRAVRELGIPLKYNTRLILGADEETACRDMEYYYDHHAESPCSFSPDGEYPVINIEKGGLYTRYDGAWEGDSPMPRVCRLDGGTVGNAVPGAAEAVLEGLDRETAAAAAEAVERETGVTFSVEEAEGRLLVCAQGWSTHASTPWEGRSAVAALLKLIAALPLAPCPGLERLKGLAELFPFGDYYGEAAGIAQEDELSGRLVLTMNVIHYTSNTLSGRIDCRAPLCADSTTVLEPLRRRMAALGLELPEDCRMTPPHHVPEESPFVQTLLRCYEDIMGEPGRCLAIGGGTYAHRLKNGVAFGASRLGTDYHMHGADEYLIVDEIMASAQLFAEVIIRLCGMDAQEV